MFWIMKGKRGRFIDIIVHKRELNNSDLICFELKKWNSSDSKDKNGIRPSEKDRNNLEKLTLHYGYEYGFYLIFGRAKKETKIEIFKNGKSIKRYSLFKNKKLSRESNV